MERKIIIEQRKDKITAKILGSSHCWMFTFQNHLAAVLVSWFVSVVAIYFFA